MRFSHIVKLIAALYLARIMGNQVLTGKYAMTIVFFLGFLYMIYASRKNKFILFSLLAIFPISFPGHFPLPMKGMIELFAPILCFFFILELTTKRQPLFSRKAAIFFAAVAVISLWSIVNYIKNPVLGSITFGADVQGSGLRSYYIIFVGLTIFLCSFWFFKYREFNVKRWLFMLLILSIVIGYLLILAAYLQFQEIPFLGFNYSWITGDEKYVAIGGLREMSFLGLSSILSLYHKKRWNFYFVFILLNFIAFLFLGGGRAQFVGVAMALIIYFALINRKYLFPVIASLMILVSIHTFFLSDSDLSESRYGRVFQWEGGFEKQGASRFDNFVYWLEIFKKNPILGKGIGYRDVSLDEEFFKEHPELRGEGLAISTMRGGHGSYVSILAIFGIGGAFFLIVMLFGSMYHAYKIVKRDTELKEDAQLALFAFLYLIIMSFMFVVGGNGVNNMQLWFMAGLVAGTKARDEAGHVKLQ